MTDEQDPFVFDWTVLNGKRPKLVPQPPEPIDDTVPPLSKERPWPCETFGGLAATLAKDNPQSPYYEPPAEDGPHIATPLSRLASGGIVKPPTAVKVADLQDGNSAWNYTPEPFSAPIHVSVERRKVDKVLEVLEGAAGQLRALNGIDVTFAVHADHRGRVEGELTIREPYKLKGVR